ncbi:hypothetical protein V5F63_23995 [Xanthobacter autotrophicus DSM 597]|uniref:hypothetical protein n=1 Tax=Xanthobacter wiegelii TaxID=3119913 RepID=UPI00372C4607
MKTMRSNIFGLAILVPALAIAGPSAFAQGAATPSPAQGAGQTSVPRQAIQWTQDRLAEADATIAALERSAATLTGEARAKADGAIKTLREQRDAYRAQADAAIANAKSWTEAQVSAAQVGLDASWAAFQSARDSYLDAAKADLATRRAVLQAELEARRTVWLQSIEDLRTRADKVSDDQRAAIKARVAALKAQVDDAQARLARLEEASSTAWKAVQKSYADARALFYETYRSIRKAIDDASK